LASFHNAQRRSFRPDFQGFENVPVVIVRAKYSLYIFSVITISIRSEQFFSILVIEKIW